MKKLMIGLTALTVSSMISAAEVKTLRLSHWLPPGHVVQTTGIQPWIDSINKASGGSLEIEIYPAQQLGSAPDHYDMVVNGIADIGYINPGYTAGRFPIFELTGVPLEASNGTDGAKAIHEWYQGEYDDAEMSDTYFCLVHPHAPGRFHSIEPIKVPADIKGKTVRPAHATMARFVRSLGGASVQVPAPEAREALARGTATAITFPYESIQDFGIDKITKFHNDLPLYLSAQVLLFNKDAISGLSPEHKSVIDEHCTPQWSKQFSIGWTAAAEKTRTEFIASPEHEVYSPTPDETALWRDAALNIIQEWKTDVKSVDPEKALEQYREALERNNAKY